MARPDEYAVYLTGPDPNLDIPKLNTEDGKPEKIAVIAVAENDDLRFMALAGGCATVIRGNACLQCCLNVCRRMGLYCVIV